jgi:hypothetical protein
MLPIGLRIHPALLPDPAPLPATPQVPLDRSRPLLGEDQCAGRYSGRWASSLIAVRYEIASGVCRPGGHYQREGKIWIWPTLQ